MLILIRRKKRNVLKIPSSVGIECTDIVHVITNNANHICRQICINIAIVQTFILVEMLFRHTQDTSHGLRGKQLNYNAMSVEELTVLANKNNSLAQRKLGEIYSLGLDGQSIDYKKGFMWFTKAALQGDAYSMCEVGKYYFGGYGIPKDLKKAYDWFSKSAEKNNANAQFMLGSMYFNAVGVEQDLKKAMTWFQKSAAQGYALGYTNTGLCYYNGLGVEKNPQKALEYTQKAAMMGCSQAQCLLGMMYGNDEVKELYNPKQAFFWMKMSSVRRWSLMASDNSSKSLPLPRTISGYSVFSKNTASWRMSFPSCAFPSKENLTCCSSDV